MANLIFYAVALFVSMVYFQGDQADARLMPLSEEDQKMVNEFLDRDLKRLRDQKDDDSKGAQMEDDDDDDEDNDENDDGEKNKSQFRQNGWWGETWKKIKNGAKGVFGVVKNIWNKNDMTNKLKNIASQTLKGLGNHLSGGSAGGEGGDEAGGAGAGGDEAGGDYPDGNSVEEAVFAHAAEEVRKEMNKEMNKQFNKMLKEEMKNLV